ncbi:YheC/YheD family protein [Bacillus pinisoli]|uniref:YheC/YheD family endospore coat-associated protein n=1 Tax=Bacillus pinisoli TaxID=2901866 RepID=UPI001FF49F93|nr:YheC/YheD family protein [Bacillus pinisoli]
MNKVSVQYIENINYLLVSYEFFTHHLLKNPSLTLKIGSWTKEIPVKHSYEIDNMTLGIPTDLLPFYLPEALTYEIRVDKDTLHLGPIIGILNSSKSSKTLTRRKKNVLRTRLQNYTSINGVVFIFSLEDLDFEEKLVKGQYYAPNDEDEWIEATLPFPDSIYNRIRLPQQMSKKISNEIGDTLFNSNHFDKYKLWKVSSEDPIAHQYVPDSISYTETNDFFSIINKYPQVYIKPIRGMQGKGIIVARKNKDTIIFQTSNGQKTECQSTQDIVYYLETHLKDKFGYILQQGIDSLYKDQKVDFRFYFQKNAEMKWICQGVVGRIAKKDSVVTNYKHLKTLLSGNKAIRRLFKVDKKEANTILDSTIEKCKVVCELIDEKVGHYGDIAIDVILDRHKQPFILEINNRIYGTKSLKRLKKKKIYRQIRTTPLAYAKALAGF